MIIPNIWKNKNVPNHQPVYVAMIVVILDMFFLYHDRGSWVDLPRYVRSRSYGFSKVKNDVIIPILACCIYLVHG